MISDPAQTIASGSRLGQYVVTRALGAGGMGEVYEAEDTRLGRKVALKVVRRDLAADQLRRQRLEREARAAAILNHPHIVTVHSLEEQSGVLFLTMELVDGATLADSIPRQGLPLERLLRLATQLTDALAAAHANGIVHGDLKPANVMVGRDGAIRVLDFGLSKISVERGAGLFTTDSLSADNQLAGTAFYTAPELIEGSTPDTQSDIFALGVVLFEMATGRRPFEGTTAMAALTSILRDAPPLASDINPGVPVELARLIDRCLVKDPARRRQSAADLRADLEALAPGQAKPAAPGRNAARRRLVEAALAVLVLMALGGTVWRGVAARPAPSDDRRIARFTIDLPKDQVLLASFNPDVALSPDGGQLAYAGFPGPISIRRLDTLEAKTLEATASRGFRSAPLFSPDGASIAFIEGNAIIASRRRFEKAAVSGGAPIALAEYDMFHRGDWAPDGWIYWTAHYPGGIVRIRASGGDIEPVTELDAKAGERSHRYAQLLPDGKSLIYTVASSGMETYNDARIDLWDLRTKTRKTLVQGGTAAAYSPSGHLVYARAGKLFAVPFDASRQEVTGDPFEVVDHVLMSTNTGAASFTVSRRGDLAYVPGPAEGGHRSLVWVDRSGRVQPLPLPPASYLYPRLSPDGRYMAVEIEGPNHDFYVYDFSRAVLAKATTDGVSHDPVWSPDGKRIAFRSWQTGRGMTMWSMPADRSAQAVRLNPEGVRESPVSFSPDARFLSFDRKDSQTRDDVLVLPLAEGAAARPFAATSFSEGSGKFSPDGRWIAYSSNESGKEEVYVQAFPGPGPKVQVSSGGGFDPVWRRSGGELYFRTDTAMMAVAVATSPEFRASAPRVLWKGQYSSGAASSCGMPGVSSSNYDVSANGERFLMVRDEDSEVAGTRIVVVLNWARELAQLTASKGQSTRR